MWQVMANTLPYRRFSPLQTKVCLQIGGLMLEVQPGTVCSHHQEVVTMGMPEQEGGSVELHRLGPMHDRLVVTPNIDELLGLRR